MTKTFFLALCAPFVLNAQVTLTYTHTGAMQTFTVPQCVYSITVDARGSKGEDCIYNMTTKPDDLGGNGGRVQCIYSVSPGQVLNIFVGGQPYNGGGNGTGSIAPADGGGASDIRIGGVALTNRVIVAGGGGGGGNNCSTNAEPGGMGGGLTGGTGWQCNSQSGAAGTGGSQTTGGTSSGINPGSPGQLGLGGNGGGGGTAAGGGGGGYYGGGGAAYGGGGGGSSYTGPGAGNVTHTQGFQNGLGLVIISYEFTGPALSVVTTPTALCNGQSATLTASGMNSYTWSAGANPNSNSIVVNPSSTTAYTVMGTNSLNCVTQEVITMTVNATAPSLSINSSTTQTCPGKAVTLTASGALQYSWTGGVTNGVPFSPASTATYVVTGMNGCGTSTADVVVMVNPLPVSLAASSTLVCQLSPVTLTASGGTSYTWSAGSQTVSTIVVNPTLNTVYTVAASDGTCQGTASLTVNTNPNPTVTAVTTDTRVCAGESVTLTATGADNYTWTPAVVTGSSGVIQPTQSQNYQVIGDNAFGCTSQATQFVLVDFLPSVQGNANKPTVCTNGTVSLQASGTANTYSWSSGDASANATVTVAQSTIFVVGGTLTATGCHNYDTVMVNVFQPTLTAGPSATICRGAAVTITTDVATGHQWSDGSNGPWLVVKPENSTVITVTANITDAGIVCSATASVSIGVLMKPSITASADRQQMCTKETATLTATGAVTYTWAGTYIGATYVYTANIQGTHLVNVIATNSVGCLDTAAVQMKVSTCSGVKEISGAGHWMVYPNPSTGMFILEGDNETSLSIVNAFGQLVKSVTLNESNDLRVSVSLQTSGIYFVSDNRTGVVRKLIVTD